MDTLYILEKGKTCKQMHITGPEPSLPILLGDYKIVVKLWGRFQNYPPNALVYFKSDINTTLIQHIYLSKLVIFDISAFSIHVNNTDVTKAA